MKTARNVLIFLLSFIIGGALVFAIDSFDPAYPSFAPYFSGDTAAIDRNLSNVFEEPIIPEILSIIESNYLNKEIDKEKFLEGAIGGMLRSLDPNSRYVSPEDVHEEDESLLNEVCGIGVYIEEQNSSIIIKEVVENGPADKAGIKAGDIIFKINDEFVRYLTFKEAMKKIKGPENTAVKITVLRKGCNEPLIFTITRAKVRFPTVKSSEIKGVLYIKMKEFGFTTAGKISGNINTYLANSKNPKLILDLRDNGGGLLLSALTMGNMFLEKDKTITIIKDRNGKELKYDSQEGIYAKIPLVVLVNQGSASASELFAAALLYNQRAVLVGTKTYGKGTVQHPFYLENKGILWLTVEEFYGPNKEQINKIGLTPNYQIPSNPDDKIGQPGKDSQLQKALELLK